MADRESRKLATRLKRAQLRQSAAPEDVDFRHPRGLDRSQFLALCSCEWLKSRDNLLITGPTGGGKTHLLCALCQELVRQDRRVYYTTCSLLVQELLVAKRDLKLSQAIERLSRYEALLIDDLGYVQQSREEMEVLFTLLAERYERGSVLLTSNLPFSRWELIFKDPMTTAAAIDRLVHHSVILELNLPSYRMEAAQQGQQAPSRPPDGSPGNGAGTPLPVTLRVGEEN